MPAAHPTPAPCQHNLIVSKGAADLWVECREVLSPEQVQTVY